MGIRKDQILVVDVEATCWEGFDAPDGQTNEIIEIGVCLLDPKSTPMTVTGKRSILVKPTESVVSPFCTDLTSITQEMVDTQGISFEEACRILEDDYDSRNRIWASWGSFDRRIFQQQSKRRGVRYPFSKKYANLKRVFQDNYRKRLSLAQALDVCRIESVGTAHRGHDDAYNTAQLLKSLYETYGMDILRRWGYW